MRGRGESDSGDIRFSARWIPDKPDDGKFYTSLAYAVMPNLMLGADYRPLTENWGFMATWRALPETDSRPALIIGTSDDDFNDLASQNVHATLSKALFDWQGAFFSPYAGATWIEQLDEVRAIGGLNIAYENWSATGMYSGTDPHLTVGRRLFDRYTLSFVWWGLEKPGAAVAGRF
ncbi:MAG: hypothetical protein ACI9TH_004697 [Kiritimatiellia bacterium]